MITNNDINRILFFESTEYQLNNIDLEIKARAKITEKRGSELTTRFKTMLLSVEFSIQFLGCKTKLMFFGFSECL